MIAAKAGDTEELERSIDEGVDVDHQNEVIMITFLMRKAVLLEKESHGFPHQRAGGLRRGQGGTYYLFLPPNLHPLLGAPSHFFHFSFFLFCSSFLFLLILSHQI